MAVYGQGAPGVRIRLRDQSEVSLVTNPNITAGIVGYSAKGEFNKIINLTSTADQDNYLGNGFNNAKFNQGLYAARAIINAGGFVEYVRPYGETIITDSTDPAYKYNQALKTDTFTVAFDYLDDDNSFDIKHYASTRFVDDGLASKGSRKINGISETLKYNSNVDFDLTAPMEGSSKVMLFAIMNNDPTAAIRAGDRLSITKIESSTTDVTVTTAGPHGLSVGDTAIIAGTDNFDDTIIVTTRVNESQFKYTVDDTISATNNKGILYINSDTINSGVDYINIKTVATGKSSKKYDYVTLGLINPSHSTNTFTMESDDGSEITFEFTTTAPYTGDKVPVNIVYDTFTVDHETSSASLIVNDISKFNVGDRVHVTIADTPEDTPVGTLPTGLTTGVIYTVGKVGTTTIELYNAGTVIELSTNGSGVLNITNITNTLRSLVNAMYTYGFANNPQTTATIKDIKQSGGVITLDTAEASKFDVGDMITIQDYYTSTGTVTLLSSIGLSSASVYKISNVNLIDNQIKITLANGTPVSISGDSTVNFKIINLTKGVVSATINTNHQSIDIIGRFGLTSPSVTQDTAKSFFDFGELTYIASTKLMYTDSHKIKESEGSVVIDSDVGRQFLNLGLAIEDYQDINFDGDDSRVYILTAEGETVAKIYVYVTYYFAGETYQFSGTLVEYAYGDTNLWLKNAAEAYENGWTLVMNEDDSLQDSISEPDFNLANSISEGIVTSTITKVAFDETDPAIINDVVWQYNPKNNVSSSTLSSAWQLFLNKDVANADMLISAGTAISNLFVKNMEQINYTVMDSMLGICEKRKDVFAIFDGVDEAKIDVALKKMVGIGSVGDLSRWGAIFDGRSIFTDNIYTKINAQAVKSIEVGAIICYNRASNVYWLPPAGYNTGRIPYSLARKQKFIRTYNYADDITSDIARLYDANINPTRVNDQGQFIYGQKTMLKRMTALNRLNVIMLIAGIHKRFFDFLDKKVFQLNTAALRSSIQAELQAQLELIKAANPAGLTAGIVICDETNNTPDIIDTNQLIVDVVLQPTKTAEFITLRTTVQRTGADLQITNSIIGG